jgi:hypothetical protein
MTTPSAGQGHAVRNLTIFVTVVLGIGFVGRSFDLLARTPRGEDGLGILLWLVVPTPTALVLRGFGGDGWKDFGIRPNFRNNARWYAIAFLVYPVLTTAILSAGAALGPVHFSDLSFVMSVTQSFLIGFGPQLLKNVFEETAWRGYLAPRVYALGFRGMDGHLLVCLVWGIWHIPYYLYFLERSALAAFTTLPPVAFAVVAIIVMVVWAIVYGELYLLTRSIWPAVLMHTVEDAFVTQLIVGRHVVIDAGATWLVSPVYGIMGVAAFLAFGVGLHAYRVRRMSLRAA